MTETTTAQEPAPSEDELRAAYEAELSRITSADLILQTVASLLNLGARRLGLTGAAESELDPEQVRDAIDGVRGLLPILERRTSASELAQLRNALSQLQMAYAQQAQRPAAEQNLGDAPDAAAKPAESAPAAGQSGPAAQPAAEQSGPGPAESSGRLWVPGR